jgi:hypothetical protein
MSKDDVVILGAGNPLLAPQDVVERVRPWIEAGIRRYQLGQPVSYGVTLDLLPGPDGNPAPRMLLYLEIPTPLLGQPPITHVHVAWAHINEKVDPEDRVLHGDPFHLVQDLARSICQGPV